MQTKGRHYKGDYVICTGPSAFDWLSTDGTMTRAELRGRANARGCSYSATSHWKFRNPASLGSPQPREMRGGRRGSLFLTFLLPALRFARASPPADGGGGIAPPVIPANAGIQEPNVSMVTFARCANALAPYPVSHAPIAPHPPGPDAPYRPLSESVGLCRILSNCVAFLSQSVAELSRPKPPDTSKSHENATNATVLGNRRSPAP